MKLYQKIGKRYKEVVSNRFDICFLEFSVLVKSCIPPTPIMRAMFWENVCGKYYNVLTQEERNNLYEWVMREYTMQKGLQDKNEDCLLFDARYDKDNQYLISTNFNGKLEDIECFKWKGCYHTSKNTSIIEKYITNIQKIN